MSQTKKLTEAEFAEIKQTQEKHHNITYRLGLFQIEKMEMEKMVAEREKQFGDEWQEFQKLDRSLADKILAKYGEGKINMDDGTFNPVDQVVTEEQRKV